MHTVAEQGATAIAQRLLDAGANVNARYNLLLELKAVSPSYAGYSPSLERDDNDTILTPMSEASNHEIALLFYRAGAPLKEISDDDVRRKVVGASKIEAQSITEREFRTAKHRRFGQSNPEVTNHAFWLEQIRTHESAFTASDKHGANDRAYSDPAIWSFSRFGQSITELPDGRWVLIAGEHEDSYDQDFCIYNDVVVITQNGDATIYSYPEEVFQPTDFHTATLVGDTVYIIGNLGYFGKRREDFSPVYSLNLETFEISEVQTWGEGPGWISDHSAEKADGQIVITGGQIWRESELLPNTGKWALSLDTLEWIRQPD